MTKLSKMTWIEKWAGNNKAKPKKFRQHLTPPENKFEIDYVLEAADLRIAIQNSPSDKFSLYNNSSNGRRQRAISFSLAKVVDKMGSRVRLRHLGTDDRNDIWMMVDSDLIRPYPSGKELTVPFGFMSSHSVWNRIINRVDNEDKIAPKEWFQPLPKDPGSNMFKIGEKLEAVDRRNAQLICPATIGDIKDNFVLVSFDGWSGTFDYWAIYNSQDLFPVGWCSKAKYRLQIPGPNYQIGVEGYSDDKIEYFVPNKMQKSLKRHQTCPNINKKVSKHKPVIEISPDKVSIPSPDNDSDCTHMCTTDDDSKPFNRVFSNSGLFSCQSNKEKDKKKAFRNIFKMWTEKNSIDLNQEKTEACVLEIDVESKDDGYKSSGDIYSSKTTTDEESIKIERSQFVFSDQISDTNSDIIIIKPHTIITEEMNEKIVSALPSNKPHNNFNPNSSSSVEKKIKVSLSDSSSDYKPLLSPQSYESVVQTCSSGTRHLTEPIDWSIEDVRNYLINKNPSLESVANEFRAHEIDGQALLLLSMNTMRQYMKIKLGPAIKVENIIKNLLEKKL